MNIRQLWGGPGHGDIVSSEQERFRFQREIWMWPDGNARPPTISKTIGHYNWNEERGLYLWEGPGADGDTIERLRLQ